MTTVGGEVKAAIGLDISEPGAEAIPAAHDAISSDPSEIAPA